jgi:hypothetical protein
MYLMKNNYDFMNYWIIKMLQMSVWTNYASPMSANISVSANSLHSCYITYAIRKVQLNNIK